MRQAIGLPALLALMVIYLPFHVIGLACDAVGKHAADLAERIDVWISDEA
jgi:hypothetical protein